jgi:RNA polymerase sigma factor (sigma-70 family)
MSQDDSRPEWLETQLAKARDGDREAENELFEYVCQRLEGIARHMFRPLKLAAFSGSDVVQEAALRLWQRCRQKRQSLLADARQFLLLAARYLRWALVDLLRKLPTQRHRESLGGSACAGRSDSAAPEPALPLSTPEQREAWERFHTLIDQPGVLDEQERAVVSLRWYFALSQKEIAARLNLGERSVKRYWHSAKEKLKRHLDWDMLQ